jgi:hypothetical protein
MTWRERTKLTPSLGLILERPENNRDLDGQRNVFSTPDNSTDIGHL